MRLNYQVTGNSDGPAILLIHGFLSSNAQWLPNLEALGRRHQLVMTELWGHGESPVPEKSAFTLKRYDQEFEQIRADLDIDKWTVIGQSYAAGLAIRYGINHPSRTHRIIVTNSRSAFGEIKTPARRPPGKSDKKHTDTNRTKNRHLPIHPIHARRLPGDIKDKLVDAADRMSPAAIERGGLIASKLNAMSILDKVPVPLMLTNGTYEKGFQADAEAIRKRFPGVRVLDLPGGHAVNIEAAAGFNSAVLNFLD